MSDDIKMSYYPEPGTWCLYRMSKPTFESQKKWRKVFYVGADSEGDPVLDELLDDGGTITYHKDYSEFKELYEPDVEDLIDKIDYLLQSYQWDELQEIKKFLEWYGEQSSQGSD